jgi:hypothetical protein
MSTIKPDVARFSMVSVEQMIAELCQNVGINTSRMCKHNDPDSIIINCPPLLLLSLIS